MVCKNILVALVLGYSSGEKDQELTDLENFAIDSTVIFT
jgi:hypothetical protein